MRLSMAVDMHEGKVLRALRALPRFEPAGEVTQEIRGIDFPAWRALFSSQLLWGHSTGYRLPSYLQFADYCRKAYTHAAHGGRFERWFEEANRSRLEQRLRFWYESGLAETYLYASLSTPSRMSCARASSFTTRAPTGSSSATSLC